MDWCSLNQEFGMGFWRRPTSYYSVLGVHENASMGEIRSAYRKLAMQWHPDRWTRSPSSAEEAKKRFQQIQEAYAVLSDERKRTMYDAGLYNPGEEEDEGFSEFVQEMLSLMSNVRKEGKSYSLEELQQMLIEMQNDQNSSTQWFAGFDVRGAGGMFGMPVSETSRSPRGVSRESNVAKRNTQSCKYAEIRSVRQQHGFCHLKNKK